MEMMVTAAPIAITTGDQLNVDISVCDNRSKNGKTGL